MRAVATGKRDSSRRKGIFKAFQAFTEVSTAHGFRYLAHPKFSNKERLFWVLMLVTHTALASCACLYLWSKFANARIQNIVENRHYASSDLVFPAVTICPVNRINRVVGLEILERVLEDTKANRSDINLDAVLNALIVMKYPTYFNMERHLRATRNYWEIFSSMNITDFLLTVSKLLCPFLQHTEDLNSSCEYFRSATLGSFSGLTIAMKEQKRFGKSVSAEPRPDVTGVLVLLSSTCEHPEAGSGFLFETKPGYVLEIEVTPVLYEPQPNVKNVALKDRRCLFADERHLSFYDYYSEHNCLLECRHKFIAETCGCQLSPFFDPALPQPTCNTSSLMCISELSGEGKIRKRATEGEESAQSGFPDCRCWPSCHRLQYGTRIRKGILTVFRGKERAGVLAVYYSSGGAIKYQKKLSFTVEELLIAIGGTASLLMGASIISVIEVLYYSGRLALYIMSKEIKKFKAKKTPPTKEFTL